MTRPASLGRYQVDPLDGAKADFAHWAAKAATPEERQCAAETLRQIEVNTIRVRRAWLAVPAIQRRKTLVYRRIHAEVDLRVMLARLNQTINGPAPVSYAVPRRVVVTSPPEAEHARELAPAGSRVEGAL